MKKAAMVFLNYTPSFKTQVDLYLIRDVQTATSFIFKSQKSDKIPKINDKRDYNKREISLFLQWFRPFYKWINYSYWQVERNTKKNGKHLKS